MEELWDYKIELPFKYSAKIDECLRLIIDRLPEVKKIYLFGSCARKEMKWDSDIDIALITERPLMSPSLRGSITSDLEEYSTMGVKADIIFRTEDFSDFSPTFKKLFNLDKKLIWRCIDVRE